MMNKRRKSCKINVCDAMPPKFKVDSRNKEKQYLESIYLHEIFKRAILHNSLLHKHRN